MSRRIHGSRLRLHGRLVLRRRQRPMARRRQWCLRVQRPALGAGRMGRRRLALAASLCQTWTS